MTPQDRLQAIGGGINGAGAANDVSGRGALTHLLERCDLARGTFAKLSEDFGHGLSSKEVDHLVDCEGAIETHHILWRGSRLGLHFRAAQTERLAQYPEKKVICT